MGNAWRMEMRHEVLDGRKSEEVNLVILALALVSASHVQYK